MWHKTPNTCVIIRKAIVSLICAVLWKNCIMLSGKQLRNQLKSFLKKNKTDRFYFTGSVISIKICFSSPVNVCLNIKRDAIYLHFP